VGEREDLLQPVEFVEQRAPRIDVPQRLDARERAEHRMSGDELAEPVEIRLRHEVGEDVEHGKGPAKAATVVARRRGGKGAENGGRMTGLGTGGCIVLTRPQSGTTQRKPRAGEGTMAEVADKSAELVARLERLPFSRWHRNLFILCFFGVMFDAA